MQVDTGHLCCVGILHSFSKQGNAVLRPSGMLENAPETAEIVCIAVDVLSLCLYDNVLREENYHGNY